MKTKSSKQEQTVEQIEALTDRAVMALVDWASMTQQEGAMMRLVYGLLMMRQARDGGVSGEELAHALGELNRGALELTGRVWGRDEAGKLRVVAIGELSPVEVGL